MRVVEGTWQETLSELGCFDCVFFDDYPGSGSVTIGEIEKSKDPRYAAVYMSSCSHFHAFANLCLDFHLKGVGSRLTGYLEQAFSLARDDCTLVTRRIPVRPPAHCKYFIEKTAVVPLVTKSLDAGKEAALLTEETGSSVAGEAQTGAESKCKGKRPANAEGGTESPGGKAQRLG